MEPIGNDRWHGAFEVDRARPLAVHGHGLDRPLGVLAMGAEAQARGAGRRTCPASCWRVLRWQAPSRSTVEQALDAGHGAEARSASARRRSWPLELIVDRERARFGSWYELFPRSWGGFAGVEQQLPQLAELGFDVVYLPPIHPIGRTHRKGRNNSLEAGAGRSGQPVGDRRPRRRAHRRQPGARHARRLRPARRGRARSSGSRSRSTSRSSARPTTPGSTSTRNGSTAARTGRSSTRRTRPSATRTSTTSTSTPRTGRASGTRSAMWSCSGSAAASGRSGSTTRTRSRSRFWEWLIREVQSEHPDVIFLAEAFTRPAMMSTLAKAGFSQSYTYFTWKNTKAELIEFVNDLIRERLARVLPAELLRQHARHPPRLPAEGRPARLRGAARPRRDAVAELRHLLRLRELGERARRTRAARNT